MGQSILVMNSGSSSLKYQLFILGSDGIHADPFKGLVERIGEPGSTIRNHSDAIAEVVSILDASGHLKTAPLSVVGHRVVHGGERFSEAVIIDDQVISGIREASVLAPLHNPSNLEGILACRNRWPDVPQVAVFDTAFHHTLPPSAYRYAIPEAPEGVRVRRYGFHGTSFASIRRQVAQYLDREASSLNLMVMHLGNGASACAIRAGKSIDTSMGMTPTAGLVMGTRCGDLDPGVLLHWLDVEGMTANALSARINHASGLKGLIGTNDMREVIAREEQGDPAAREALAVYVHRLRHYIGAYRAQLPLLDALVFTGGIGEHAAKVRAMALEEMAHLGFVLDEKANGFSGQGIKAIHRAESPVAILVVPTDEEREIAQQAADLLGQGVSA